MNFIIKQKTVKEIIKNLGALMTAKVTKDILNGVLFELSPKGLTITASDGDETIKQRTDELDVNDTGTCVIPRDFLRTITKLTGEMEFSLDGYQLTVSKGKTKLQTVVLPADEYPDMQAENPMYQLKYTGKQWSDIVTATAYAASTSDTRPVLQGVHIDVSAAGQKFVCTDSHRMGEICFTDGEITEELAITLPGKMLQATLNSFDLSKDVMVVGFRNYVALFNSNIIHTIRAIEGNYPDTARLIPESYSTEIVVARQDLLDNMRLLNSMLNTDSSIVTFEIANNSLGINTKAETKNGETYVECEEIIGKGLKISLNAVFFIEAVLSFKSDYVRIKFTGPLRPFVMVGESEDDSHLALMLPVRTY
ncbi:DNA polymerase III subunit beta [Lysinibacillus xylanilyticus]|uniref:DNA polymerase III subunit beta n=1 Tax=Lysinibacillus xylanilyticus TaxID=582475 RepID=UPI002B25430B|nr:DNA polymerase III subunit beta [Lysinibacillus xylanilyticus]MEB2301610.1 DNA polymerase III subunit beta [Lysinibacillus xylanilyticus]